MRAVLYARYSTDRQSESSIADQLRVCRELAARSGWRIAGEYTDEGISGAALGNRPGVQAALAAVRAGDVLLVNDLSRLARSQDLAPLVARLRHRGVRVIGAQDGFDSESRAARMQAGLSGIMSEEFRAMVADRTRSALEQRAREGRSTGGRAYGNVEIIREVFARFAGGETMKTIVSDLNRRGVPSPGADWNRRHRRTDGRWLVSTLHELLRNERYAGRVIWNRSQWVRDPDTGRRIRRERPREEWIVHECEPVIDEATWHRVQARFRTGNGRGGPPSYLLSGLLECGLCGSKLIVMGGSQRRYVCGTFHGGGKFACANDVTVARTIAEEKILEPVVEDLLSPEAIAEGVKALRAERTALERIPLPADREVRELERLVREGILSAETAAPALAEARRRAQEARSREAAQSMPWPSPTAWREAVLGMRRILQGDNIAAARDALREILGTVRCVPEGDHLVAELRARPVLLATGTGKSIWDGSGGLLRIHIPSRMRHKWGAGRFEQ